MTAREDLSPPGLFITMAGISVSQAQKRGDSCEPPLWIMIRLILIVWNTTTPFLASF